MMDKANFTNLFENDLSYFVEWDSRLWTPAVRWVLGDPDRFYG